MKTMICLVLDRSGSMAGRETDVIGGVNQFLEEQKKLAEPASVAFVRFDNVIERFRAMTPLDQVEPLTASDFQPRGSTALLDAVGQTIVAMDDDWRAEKPDRAILVIVTDGQENASREYTREQVKNLIQAREASGLWGVIYLGANVDAFAEGGSLGIRSANTASYKSTERGVAGLYRGLSASVTTMRGSGQTYAGLGGDILDDGSVDRKTPLHQSPTTPIPITQSSEAWQPPADVINKTVTWAPPS